MKQNQNLNNDNKKNFIAIGLMSGTSMDGINLAMIESDGEAFVRHLGDDYQPFTSEFKQKLQNLITSKVSLLEIKQIENELTILHASLVNSFIKKQKLSPCEIDLIGFHGQTILHAPSQKITWQLGNAALLANMTKINVIADLRQQDVIQGGQGAPLVPIYHRALFLKLSNPKFGVSLDLEDGIFQSSLKLEQNPALVYQGTQQCGDADISARKNYTGNPKDSDIFQSSLKPEQNPALVYQGTPQCGDADISARKNYTGNPKDSGIVVLNIGGISNLTSFNQNPDSLIAFDCCYGNAPFDDFMRKKFKRDFDLNGEFSSLGKANEKLAEIVLSHKIFHQIPPKSYHRSDFEEALQPLNSLPDYDYLATLCMIFAKAIKLNLEFLQNLSIKNKNKIIPKIILLCGGGRKNLALIGFLQQELPEIKVLTTDEVGLSGDIVEAEAFAYLAIRSVFGLSNSFFLTTGVQNCQNQFGCVGGVLFNARY